MELITKLRRFDTHELPARTILSTSEKPNCDPPKSIHPAEVDHRHHGAPTPHRTTASASALLEGTRVALLQKTRELSSRKTRENRENESSTPEKNTETPRSRQYSTAAIKARGAPH